MSCHTQELSDDNLSASLRAAQQKMDGEAMRDDGEVDFESAVGVGWKWVNDNLMMINGDLMVSQWWLLVI